MVLVYMLTKMGYIDGIYVSIYTSTMDPRGMYAWNSKLAWNPKVSVWKMIFSHWTWQINEGRLVGQGHTWKPNDQITFLWGAGPQISGVKTWFLQIIWDQVAILCQNCRESLFQHAIWYINIYLYIYIYLLLHCINTLVVVVDDQKETTGETSNHLESSLTLEHLEDLNPWIEMIHPTNLE